MTCGEREEQFFQGKERLWPSLSLRQASRPFLRGNARGKVSPCRPCLPPVPNLISRLDDIQSIAFHANLSLIRAPSGKRCIPPGSVD